MSGGITGSIPLRSLHLLTQDVVVPHQESLIYFSLSEPALFFRGEENFHSHSLAPPLAHPDLPVSPFADLFHHLDLLGDGPLHLETADTRVPLSAQLSHVLILQLQNICSEMSRSIFNKREDIKKNNLIIVMRINYQQREPRPRS